MSAFVKRIVENEEGCGSQRETSLPTQSSMHTYSYSKACKNPVHACIGYMSVSMGVCVFVCVCVCGCNYIIQKQYVGAILVHKWTSRYSMPACASMHGIIPRN